MLAESHTPAFSTLTLGETAERILFVGRYLFRLVGMMLKHELWKDIGGEQYSYYTFCLAGPHGDGARKSLSPKAELIWSVEADSHFAAMTAYYEFMDWGVYTTNQEWDRQPYPEEWSQA